jgi:uncharacterized heparinase superfamily protein
MSVEPVPGGLLLYAETIARLKPIQIIDRVRRRLFKPRVDSRAAAPPIAATAGVWTPAVNHRPSWDGGTTFVFLNRAVSVAWPAAWNDHSLPLLWLYNLHYFADLHAVGAVARLAAHRRLVDRWIDENPPFDGVGWEPYPVSLRLRNWLRWWAEGEQPDARWLQSAATQARWLAQRLEFHLLGNHLLENAYALFAAGCFFDGEEASAWRKRAASLIDDELSEQVLADGGHFERSAMYHSLLLEGLLDSINCARRCGHREPAAWSAAAVRMLEWLEAVAHPDGEIPLLNDAVFGIAASPGELSSYARRLLGTTLAAHASGIDYRASSGLAVMRVEPWHLIADAGALSPPYIAGHGHADTLCFELSVSGRRLVVDPGVSTYENRPERWFERSTAAHNTVTVDGRNSSNVWHAFRTGRQARVLNAACIEATGRVEFVAEHDGYTGLPGKPVHRRRWSIDEEKVSISDHVAGDGMHQVAATFHFGSEWRLLESGERTATLRAAGDVLTVRVTVCGPVTARWSQGSLHPEFGQSVPVPMLQLSGEVRLPVDFGLEFSIPQHDQVSIKAGHAHPFPV